MALTAKQEKYVQGLVAGLSQRQAYIEAYPAAKEWKDNSVDSNASQLLSDAKVLQRYRELLKQGSNMALWSREQAFMEYEWLKNEAKSDIAEQGIRQANSNAFVSALEGMNQMTFTDLELADKKLLLEIEKLQTQIGGSESQDDKIAEYIALIKDVVTDGG